ncbi:LysM peptidoglycan-binding domain-containing protein [Dethiothermospora halolimnae]|uniref:LysM peptidoglycan-binding domain-containing protein n=1 Tax=Dethiothermospora halolimnae TaxID=3114390 RepID=UPI003CCBDD75
MKSKYQFWLSFNNGEQRLQLPVNPPKIKIENGMKNETIDVSNLGEITVIQKSTPKKISIESIFPANDGPYCEYKDIPEPQEAVDIIESWQNSEKPIRFLITNTNINYPVSIEKFTTTEKAGDIGTISYNLELKEYRFIEVKEMEEKNGEINIGSKEEERTDERSIPKLYIVKAGDCLYKIAKSQLGDGSRYGEIAKLNNIKPDYTIYPNQKLKLPN